MKVGKELRERRRVWREEKMRRCEAGGNLRARRKERERRNGRAERRMEEVEGRCCLGGLRWREVGRKGLERGDKV